jgi:hypothetical protein
LQAWTNWTPSARSHRWRRRRKKKNTVARAWTWFIGTLLVVTVTGVLIWQIEDHLHRSVANGNSVGEAALSMIRGSVMAPWQQDVLDSLDKSAGEVGVGQISQAEIGVDRAASLLAAARLRSQRSESEFFQRTITGLDRVWNQRPSDDRLFQHVTQARIELATLRVAQNGPAPEGNAISIAPNGKDPSWNPAEHSGGGNSPAAGAAQPVTHGDASAGESSAGRISIGAPREIAANFTLNPASLGGSYLDATLMPDTAEILLPPARRSFDDNVRVENMTISGASQTLDAIHWSNVTFVGTRLRYEKGPLDLENVHFVGCTFGFPPDVQGSRLANAIALGQTSFTDE